MDDLPREEKSSESGMEKLQGGKYWREGKQKQQSDYSNYNFF